MRRFLRKKGFTLVELIVVVAIIAVLLAMILPSLSSRDANKKSAMLAARDFYSATQSLFTKYSKYEAKLYFEQTDSDLLKYDMSLGGNYPNNDKDIYYIGVAMCVRKSKIEYVDIVGAKTAVDCETKLYRQGDVSTTTVFEQMFINDIEPLFVEQDGIYYAYVYFKSNADAISGAGNTNTVRVLASAYCMNELPPCGDSYDDFRNKYLLLEDNGLSANEDFFGVCSSTNNTILNKYIGEPGSYFSLYFKDITP